MEARQQLANALAIPPNACSASTHPTSAKLASVSLNCLVVRRSVDGFRRLVEEIRV